MKVNVKKIYKIVFLFSIFYMYTKAFWDTYSGPVGKIIFYGSVFWGIFMFISSALINFKGKNFFISLFFLFYAIYIIINGKFLSNHDQFSQGMLEYILYTFYFVSSCYYIRKCNLNEKDLTKFIYLGTIISVLALYEYLSKSSILPNKDYKIYYFAGGFSSFRAHVFCESPMTLCMMLGMLFLFSCYMIYVKKNNKLVIPTIFLLLGMFCTGSRGPLIATLCGAITIIFLKWCREPLTKKKTVKTLIFIYLFFIIFVVLIQMIGIGAINTGISSIDNIIRRFTSALDFQNEWGNVERLRIWSNYIKILKYHFWTGIGIAHTSSSVATNTLSVTESGLLKRLVETGFLGTILYFIMICMPIIYFSVINKREGNVSSNSNDLNILVVALFIAVGIEDIVLQLFADVMVMYVFWAFVALAYHINSIKIRKN